jgi:hypothetical protein
MAESRRFSPFGLKIEQKIKQGLERWHVPGVAIAVVHNDQTYLKVRFVHPVRL